MVASAPILSVTEKRRLHPGGGLMPSSHMSRNTLELVLDIEVELCRSLMEDEAEHFHQSWKRILRSLGDRFSRKKNSFLSGPPRPPSLFLVSAGLLSVSARSNGSGGAMPTLDRVPSASSSGSHLM